MSFLSELSAQLQGIWNRWSTGQRLTISAAVVFSALSLIGVGYWAMTPQYVVLANQLTPGQTADYVSALESAGVDYQLNFAGSAISVPQTKHNQARLAVRDLLEVSDTSETDLAGGIWTDPAQNQERLLRNQEARLARTIEQLKPIRSATVHISRKESSPFVRDQSPTRASVTLDLKPGVAFGGSESAAVVSQLAHSVEGLTPENVTILSTDGRLLSAPTGVSSEVSGQLEYRTMLEANLASKAEHLLIPLLGVGNATVRVSAEIDFTETERTERKIDAENKGKVKETLRSESYQGADSTPLGPPGTSSNLNVPATTASARSGQHESEDVETEYINGETTDLIRELPGKVKRLTIAAVVQLPEQTTNADPSAAATAGTADTTTPTVTKQEVESIIRNAVGFDATRGDEIEVVAATLAGVPELIPPVGFFQNVDKYMPLIKALSLGIAAIAASFLGLQLIRKLQPVVVETSPVESLSPEVVERLNELSNQMKDNPEVITTVLASWLKESKEESTEKRRAA